MIRTKTPVYSLRIGGYSKIYIEISEEFNDEQNSQFVFQIQDYVFESGQKKIINSKRVTYSYLERDELKRQLVEIFHLEGTESEINKTLKPYALLYITQNDPLYNLTVEGFELNN